MLIECRGDVVMLLVDFKDALNLVDRSVILFETRVQCPSPAPWDELCYSQAPILLGCIIGTIFSILVAFMSGFGKAAD